MIRHAVFCRFSSNADIAAISTALKGLQTKVPGILAISFGPNNSPEGLAKGSPTASRSTSPMPRRAMPICRIPITRRWGR